MRAGTYALGIALFLSLGSTGAEAGRFRVTDSWLIETEDGAGVRVGVSGEAVYKGKVTKVESSFFYLWTFLNRDHDGSDDLDRIVEWNYNEPLPDEFGEKLIRSKNELEHNYKIACVAPDFCSAADLIPYCSDESTEIKYRGAVGIYFGSGTVIGYNKLKDSDLTPIEETTCGHTVGGIVENLDDDLSVTIEGTFRPPNSDPTTQTVTVTHGQGNFTGEFEFPEEVRAYSTYEVEVISQPANDMRCSVDPATASGTVSNQDIDDIRVVCSYTCHAGNSPAPMGGAYDQSFPTTCYPIDDPQHCSTPELVRSDSGFTVADLANNLLWTWDFVGVDFGYRYDQARDLCSGLTLEGRSDWRLPDISQLKTLLPDCGGGVMANCNIDPTGARWTIFWSTSGAPYPDDCPSYGVCAHCVPSLGSCGWKVLFQSTEEETRCGGPVYFNQRRTGGLARCVTHLVP